MFLVVKYIYMCAKTAITMNTPNSKYEWKTVFCIRNLHLHVSTWPQWSILFPCSLYGIFCTTTSTFILHRET